MVSEKLFIPMKNDSKLPRYRAQRAPAILHSTGGLFYVIIAHEARDLRRSPIFPEKFGSGIKYR